MAKFKVIEFNFLKLFIILVLIQFIPQLHWRIAVLGVLSLIVLWGLRHNQSNRSSLYSLALRDELTGVYNFRYFQQRLEEEVERSHRFGSSFCLLMVDLDHFKVFNDRCGHQCGNEALKEVASIFLRCTRTLDIVARYGGDEFAIICPNTGISQAHAMAERIRERIANTTFRNQQGELTVSIGISQFDQHESLQEFITRTDKKMYKSKQQGRNMVYVS